MHGFDTKAGKAATAFRLSWTTGLRNAEQCSPQLRRAGRPRSILQSVQYHLRRNSKQVLL